MKVTKYFFVLNILGIFYTTLYLVGFFTSNSINYSVGAVGMFIWIRSLITDDRKKIISFYTSIVLFTLVFLFFKIVWYKTFFWVTFAFAAGQLIPSLIMIIGVNKLIDKTETVERIKLFSIEALQITAMLLLPILLRNIFKI